MGDAQNRWGSVYRKNRIDLDRGAERQAGAADGDARVNALVPQDLDHQVRRGIERLGMVGKAGRRIDEAVEAHELDDAVEVAQRGFGLREEVEGAKPRRLAALGEVELGADLAGNCDLAVNERQLAGNEELTVDVKKVGIAADRGHRLGKNEAKRLQACFDLSRHGASLQP